MNNKGGEDLVEAPEKNTMSTLGGKPTFEQRKEYL